MIRDTGIPNLFCVDSMRNIWRGGQPTIQGWRWVCEQGITDVVKLDTNREGSDIDSTGVRIHYLPISLFWQWLFRPSQLLVVTAVGLMTENVLVHCRHGQDRTGLIVGCYRLSMGWPKQLAYAEMLDKGFHDELRGLLGRWNTQDPDFWKEWRAAQKT